MDIEKASTTALCREQKMLILGEKMESAISIGKKLISWVDDFEAVHFNAAQKQRFHSAGSIIRSRLEYLVDSLNLQMIRLKRAQGHSQLSRLGVGISTSIPA